MEETPVSPDEATHPDQVRRFLRVLTGALIAAGLVLVGEAVAFRSPRAVVGAALVGAFGTWLLASPLRVLAAGNVESIVKRVAVALIALVVGLALLQPFVAFVAAIAMLIPVAVALPYLGARSLRLVTLLAWTGTVATAAFSFLPGEGVMPPAVEALAQLVGFALAGGVVLFLLYESSERVKQSGHEFRRLVRFSSDLAATTEPAVLGGFVARHLAEATGFDDCVIYALDPETSRLGAFGSHPSEEALAAGPETLDERPLLGRVLRDRARIVIDVGDRRADIGERARLRANGRSVMLLLPLVTRTEPVGVAELTARHVQSVDGRRLALAQTLAFEAAMAIENGRLYHQLRERALHDPLTGLANRSLFYDRVEHALTRLERREEAIVAVLFIDLDNFKGVNDALGHARGDRLLVLVAERLRAVVRPADTVARLGGDEFALLLEELATSGDVLAVADRVGRSFERPFDVAGQALMASASIGVALRLAPGTTADELVQEADVAMYDAKQAGKGRAVLFRPDPMRPPKTPAVPAEPPAVIPDP